MQGWTHTTSIAAEKCTVPNFLEDLCQSQWTMKSRSRSLGYSLLEEYAGLLQYTLDGPLYILRVTYYNLQSVFLSLKTVFA